MIDILQKISSERLARNWSEYQLAVKSGLPQSTISSWYRKNMLPSLTSLEKICDAFDITLSQFFSSSTMKELTSEQQDFLQKWNLLSPEQKKAFLNLMDSIVCLPQDMPTGYNVKKGHDTDQTSSIRSCP